MKKIRLSILGATGSIGRSALSVIGAYGDLFEVIGLSCGKNYPELYQHIRRFAPDVVCVESETQRALLTKLLKEDKLKSQPQIMVGDFGLKTLSSLSEIDTTLVAVSGAAGLLPLFSALKSQKKVALANKESLVMAGDLLKAPDRKLISPVDSEHSAIFQALHGSLDAGELCRLILTASGGPFRGYTLAKLKTVTREEALGHPSWSMGPKITIDSATMLNKGFEVIEAHHLFQVPYEKISVKVHPQSIVHSLIEYPDGSMLAQLGPTDMRLAIAYALTHPLRLPLLESSLVEDYKALELSGNLSFEEPDRKVFRALALAEEAGARGGTHPAVLNAAGEVAVSAFLSNRIPFYKITETLEECLNHIPFHPLNTIDDALVADKETRLYAEKLMGEYREA